VYQVTCDLQVVGKSKVSILIVRLMDKSLELNIFKCVYGQPNDWNIIPSEAPDFICLKDGKPILGVEVTELFTDQSDARLNKIHNYTLDLLNGGDFLHKEDKENIIIDRIKYIKNGESDGPEINAVIKELPSLAVRSDLLSDTIETKEGKVDKYIESSPAVDLIINDTSHLFFFDKYEDLIVPLSRLVNKGLIINSKFREIFLITITKDNSKVRIPLKLNLFAQDISILEKIIFEWKKQENISDTARTITILLYCLYKSGYKAISVITENKELGLIVGSHLFVYTKNGKNIRDYSTINEHLPKGKNISEIEDNVTSYDKEIANKILEDKQKYNCCLNLFMKVESI
jgi:hypothetical protein